MIYLFLANGFEETEALCPLDLLRRAGLEVTTVGVGGDMICGAHGIVVQADIPDTMYHDPCPEMIVLPGGMPGATHLDESPVVHAAVTTAAGHGAFLAAICAAPMILGKRGLLKGKKATCFPGFESHLSGAILSGESVVRDGNVITAKGMGVALDFGLCLVATLINDETARELRRTVQAN